jgi:hypothetical protein
MNNAGADHMICYMQMYTVFYYLMAAVKSTASSFDIIFLMANAGFFSEFEKPKAAKSSALLQQMSASDVKDR